MGPMLATLAVVTVGCAAGPGPAPVEPTSTVTAPAPPSPSVVAEPLPTPTAGADAACPGRSTGLVERPEVLRGINAAGGEFTHTAEGLPGVEGRHYLYPGSRLMEHLRARGHCLVRVPFRWERVQPELSGELSEEGLAELATSVDAAADAGLVVLLDLHNYGRFIDLDDRRVQLGEGIGDDDLADLWRRLAEAFADQPAIVGWGLMNEPYDLDDGPSPTVWHSASQAAVTAIRSTGDRRTVFVAGDKWGGARQWAAKNGDPWVEDPGENVVYEAHYYFAPDNSGRYDMTYDDLEADARERGYEDLEERVSDELDDFLEWLDVHGERGFVGEVGWPKGADAERWNAVGGHVLDTLAAADVGWTYWATGEFWGEDYALNAYDARTLEPQPQARVIEERLGRSSDVP